MLDDPAYTAPGGAFGVHTRWIETEFTGEIAPYTGLLGEDDDAPEPEVVVVEVNGRRLEVKVPANLGGAAGPVKPKKPTRRARSISPADQSEALTSPMQGTIVKTAVSDGDTVSEGDLIVVLEAMKMEQPISAHHSGVVRDLVEAGTSLTSGGSSIIGISFSAIDRAVAKG